MAIDLFQRDQDKIERAQAALDAGTRDPDVLSELLSDIAQAHAKTVKRAEKLVRLSDRSEARLRDASDKIKEQQRQLELAHEMMAGYADDLESEVKDRTAEVSFERAKLAKLVDLGIAMAAERDESTLLGMILDGAMELTNADGGTFYLVRDDGQAVQFRIIRNKTLGVSLGQDPEQPIAIPDVPLKNADTGEENRKNVVSNAVLSRKTVNIPDAYNSDTYDFSGTKKFDETNGYRSESFLTVPLTPRGGSVIGALQLINSKDPETGETVPFDEELQGFVEALAAQGAMTIDNQKLLMAQRNLMDSFIELIAAAIDAKSPYTGGHCNRVPEIAHMLARRAHDSNDGPFAGFRFEDDDEWREFRIGAWLHDCGKVTTPEYVVDKATKLETIYNRIHEIRMRFEVLYRDRRIAKLEDCAIKAGADISDLEGALSDDLASLRDDYAFIAKCNIGGEFLEDSAVERLTRLSALPWTRYFDDRLGLSMEEERRYETVPPVPVPAPETLLADNPNDIVERNPDAKARFEALGFRMDIPDNLSNTGELYNLSIKRGTLNDEERFKINEHIIQTIIMLETLPFPPNMRKVPEIAGGHHETMIGTGYPRRLSRAEMSIPARIMAIADIFEALTASDRPYKKAKTLSEALRIMGFMCKDQHIDPDLFALFLEDGVYLRYAEEYLDPSQIDDVSIDGLLETARTCADTLRA